MLTIAEHPKSGDLLEGTGGVRVIYYFHDEGMPLYLITLFANGDRANLSTAERNELWALTGILVETWRSRKK